MKKYKYDIAISVAEEDLPVANLIAVSLKRSGVSYYLYTEHKASNWGRHILEISLGTYASEARYVLMLTSKTFVQKYWAGIEHQISHIFSGDRQAYILQLRLDDAPLDGMGRYKVFIEWRNNPDEVARIVKEKIGLLQISQKPAQHNKTKRVIIVAIGSLLFTGCIYLLNNGSGRNLGNLAMDVQLQPAIILGKDSTNTNTGFSKKDIGLIKARHAAENSQPDKPSVKKVITIENTSQKSATPPMTNILAKMSGRTYSKVRASDDMISFSGAGTNKISFSGNCGIYSIYGTMLLQGGSLKIINGNAKGVLDILEDGERISGSIEIISSPGNGLLINYRNFNE